MELGVLIKLRVLRKCKKGEKLEEGLLFCIFSFGLVFVIDWNRKI